MIYTKRAWHTVEAPCQYPAVVGGICIHIQTTAMRAPAFYYFDSWDDVPEGYQDIRDTPEWTA